MKTLNTSIRFMILMVVLTGFFYPGVMTLFARLIFPSQAAGSLLKNSQGQVIGSELIGQAFKSEKYFWPRPSATDYNPMPSGGTNLGVTSQDLLAKVKERESQGLTGELLFASASGLDPHITPKTALGQVSRIAGARGLSETALRELIEKHVDPRQMGFLGIERVNVLKLNLALDAQQ